MIPREHLKKFFLISVIAVSFFLYIGALRGDFVYDDEYTVLGNEWIKDIKTIPKIFTSGVWEFMQYETKTPTNHYRPMMHLIFMANYHIFGLQAWGFHLTNIILHSLNAVLVYLIAAALLKGKIEAQPCLSLESQQAGPAAGACSPEWLGAMPPFMAAMIFAAHPVQTEAVTFISDITDISYAFFYLLAFYSYIKGRIIIAAASLFLSMLSKETAVTFPLVVMAYDFIYRRQEEALATATKRLYISRLVRRYLPIFVVIGIYFILRINALGGVVPITVPVKLNRWQIFINALPIFAQHLEKLILPVNLNVFHVYYPIKSIFAWKGIVSLSVASGFLALVYFLRKNRPAVFSLLFIVIPLLPGFYIAVFPDNVFAERRLYLAVAGFAVLLVMGMKAIFNIEYIRRKGFSASLMLIPFFALLLAYSVGTVKRNAVWREDITLWTDTVRKSPEGYTPHFNLGVAFEKLGQYEKAVSEYKTAILINPYRYVGYAKLGRTYKKMGRLDDSIEAYKTTIRLSPLPEIYNNLGNVYFAKGMFNEAAAMYNDSLKLIPGSHWARYNLALVYMKKGDMDRAITEYRAVLKIRPDFVPAHNNLGRALFTKGRIDEAIEHFNTVLSFKPESAEAHIGLASAYKAMGMYEKAVEHQNIAGRLKQTSAEGSPSE